MATEAPNRTSSQVSLGRNFAVGVAASVWTAVVGLVAVPLYLHYLGVANYGLIGFCATLQALLQLLDLGLSASANRELASSVALDRMSEGRKVLGTLAVVYWATAGVLAVLVVSAAPLIATHWLNAAGRDIAELRNAVMLMGLVIACRWPIGLYQGALTGMNRLAVASGISMVMATISALGAVLVLACASPTVEAFLVWQAGAAMVQALAMRAAAWRIVGKDAETHFDAGVFARIWRFSAGVGGIAIASAFLIHLDKVLFSRMLNAEAFGHYVLAGVVAGTLQVLVGPMFSVIYPRMTGLVVRGEREYLLEHYRLGSQLLGSVLFPLAFGIACFATDLITIWTGRAEVATAVAPILSLLIVGSALNGISTFPFALQLAHGRTDIALRICIGLGIVLLPLIVVLAHHYGPMGGGVAWLTINALNLAIGSYLTNRCVLVGRAFPWLRHDVGLPFACSAAMLCTGAWLWRSEASVLSNLVLAASLMFVALSANLLLLPREIVARLIRGKLHVV